MLFRSLTIQAHPEFTKAYVKRLIEVRRGHVIPADIADEALGTLDTATESPRMATWIAEFVVRAR